MNMSRWIRWSTVLLLAADATDLFDELNVLSRVPLAGGGPQPFGLDYRPFALNGDFIYGLEELQEGVLLTKAAKTPGAWQRIKALGEGAAVRIRFVGDRYFVEVRRVPHFYDLPGLLTGKLSATTMLPAQMVEPGLMRVTSWAATSDTLYWTDGRRIYQRAILQ
jgi:hypothetical protein